MHEKSWGERDMCQCAALHRTDLLSCQSLGFFGQVRFSTEPIVKEKGPINLSCPHMYQLLQSTRFEMYLLVILHFDSALGEGGAPFHRLYRYVQRQSDVFLRHLVRSRISILVILVSKWVWFLHSSLELGMFFRRSYFFHHYR